MPSESNPVLGHELDADAMRIAWLIAGDYAKSPEFKGYGQEDISQDLLLNLIEKAPLFNPALNDDWKEFVRARCEEKAKNLRKQRRGKNAKAQRELTIDIDAEVDESESGEVVFLAETIAAKIPDVVDVVATRIDLAEAMARLPDDLQSVATRMGDEESLTEIGKTLGMNPVQFHRHCATPIRRALASVC